MTSPRESGSRRLTPRDAREPRWPLAHRLLLIGAAALAMGSALLAVGKAARPPVDPDPEERLDERSLRPATIVEAERFGTHPGMLAVQPDARRRPDAHPRTLATFRLLRSYPGAPPRVPHGLTSEEFRGHRCNTCHRRGGYSPRFGAYAPIVPHPDQEACLQCHATNDALVGVPFPRASPDEACRQCHHGTPARFAEEGLDWQPAAWPSLTGGPGPEGPMVPHELTTRGNCLTCHQGPGAVAEIRVRHPERTDCLQCHVAADPEATEFRRPGGSP